MTPSGQARTEVDIVDVSVLVNTGLKGIIGVSGITERGEPNKAVLIGSWIEYQREFGGDVSGSIFPHICRRALENGGRLKISRVAHYANIADKTTIEGVKASLAVTQASVAATGATSVFTFSNAGTATQIVTFAVNTGLGSIVLGTFAVPSTPTTTTVAAAAVTAINAGTSTHGYSAGNSSNVLTITAPSSLGAAANTYIPSFNVTGSGTAVAGTFGASTFTGGVTAQTVYGHTATAKSIGAWGNNISYQFKAPANNQSGTVDLYVNLAGYPDLSEFYPNISTAFTGTEQNAVNGKSKLISFSNVTGTLCPSNVRTLANGAQNINNIVPADYIGDMVSQTGIRSFDTHTDIVKVAVPELANPLVDMALAQYADARKDIRVILRTPVGLDGQGIIGYRNGTSPYSHTAIDTWRASMFTGGLRVLNPFTSNEEDVTEIGDVLGAYSRKDNNSLEWFTVGGPKRGKIKNALGVVYDLGSPARQAIADAVDVSGVNAVINHESFGPVIWGNSTLQRKDTLLKHDNVADLMIALTRGLKPLIQSELFDPNDVETWKAIHRRVVPLMEYIKNNRGIWRYLYQGDQDIDDVTQATVNSPSNIDAGQYVFNLFIAPKVGMKYQGVKVIVANSGVKFEELNSEGI